MQFTEEQREILRKVYQWRGAIEWLRYVWIIWRQNREVETWQR